MRILLKAEVYSTFRDLATPLPEVCFDFLKPRKQNISLLVGQTFDDTRRNFKGLYSGHSAKFYRDNAWKSKLHNHCNIDNRVKKIQQSMLGAWGRWVDNLERDVSRVE